jgi:hypothetical protein
MGKEHEDVQARAVKRVGWIARGLGTLSGAWWLLSGVAHLSGGREPWTAEGALLGVLIVTCATGVVLAWWRARLGGVVLTLAGAALCVFAYITAGHNKGLAVLVSGAPFFLAGILLCMSTKREETPGS